MVGSSLQYNSDNINKWVYFICFISVFTQIPTINTGGLSRIVWLVFFVYVVKISNFSIPLSSILFFPIGFDVYGVLKQIIFGQEVQVNSGAMTNINMSIFIFIVGMMIGQFFTKKMFVAITKSYIISTLFVSVVVWFTAIRGRVLSAGGYLYGAKNSFASIMLCELVIIVIMKEDFFKGLIGKILYYFLVIYNIYMLLYLKSRTTLVSAMILVFLYILFSNTKMSNKIIIFAIIIAVAIFIAKNEMAYDFVVNNILLKGKEADDINGITSGRMSQIDIFKMHFPEHPWVGGGYYFIESFPIASLLTFGICGSIFLFAFALSPLIIGITCLIRTKNDKMALVLIATSISLIVNGFGEAAVPFGPGVKCFLMWLLAGICNYIILCKENINVQEDKIDEAEVIAERVMT